MKLAIMQPYFLPYLGYFQLINKVDAFILLDEVQFIRHGWIERNRILMPNGNPVYIKVPLVKHHRESKVSYIEINNTQLWKEKILAQLTIYKKRAPNYQQVIYLLNEIFKLETDSIVSLNHFTLKVICDYLKIMTPIHIWSEMNIEIEKVNASDEWALNICKALNAKTYYNPEGGLTFFDKSKYENIGIQIKFMKSQAITYSQFKNEFVPFLSVIDVLMFNSKEEIQQMLQNYELI